MDMLQLDYFYGQESEQFARYHIPKLLMTNPAYKDISTDAKVLYGMMLDRMSLSRKNEWFDEENRVYIIFTVADIEEQLCCCHDKAVKLLAELDDKKGIGLIQRVRRGLGKPSIIYVKNFLSIEASTTPEQPCSSKKSEKQTSRGLKNRLQEVRKTDFKKSGKQTSGGLENRLQEVRKTDANKTNINNTDLSNTDSIYPSIDLPEGGKMDGRLVHPQIEGIRMSIRQQIEFDTLAEDGDTGLLTEIVNIMVKVMCSASPTMRISGQDVPMELIKDAYRRLRPSDIEGVILAYKAVEEPIQNPTAYMTSMLYHAPDSGMLLATNLVKSRRDV